METSGAAAILPGILLPKLKSAISTLPSHDSVLAAVTKLCVPHLADLCIGVVFSAGQDPEQVSIAFSRTARHPSQHLFSYQLFHKFAAYERLNSLNEVQVISSIMPQWLDAVAENAEDGLTFPSANVHSVAILPVSCAGLVVGALGLFMGDSQRQFSPEDLLLCTVVKELLEHHLTADSFDNSISTTHLEAQHEIQSLSRQLAVLRHEMRNAVAVIESWTSRLEQGDSIAQGRSLREAIPAIQRSAKLLQNLQDGGVFLERSAKTGEVSQHKLLDLNQLVADCVDDALAIAYKRGVSLTAELCSGALSVRGDAVKLSRVFANLLINAIKFTGPGGTVCVSSRCSDGQARVEVRDNGIGFISTVLPDASPPPRPEMVGAHGSKPISGLGLTIAAEIVAQHGGQIWAESAGRDLGSIFRVAIPLAPSYPETCNAEDASEGALSTLVQPVRILLLEDVSDVLAVLTSELEALGHTVLPARNAVEAIEVAQRELPDLIISDLKLPGSDGCEFIKQIRQTAAVSSIPAIALSGLGSSSKVEQAMGAGFDACLRKPAKPKELHSTIGRLTQNSSRSAAYTAA